MIGMNVALKDGKKKITSKKEALEYSRAHLRVCYSDKDFDDLENETDTTDLVSMTLKSGHHSAQDHHHVTLYLTGIPKFGAMILNNEKVYVTSEKSARYTQMRLEGLQKRLYEKWIEIFKLRIKDKYDKLDDKTIQKLAQENARYLTSVFTPTKMTHTISFRQLCYIAHFFNNFIASSNTILDPVFENHVKSFMGDFISSPVVSAFYEPSLDPRMKRRSLSMFAKRPSYNEEWGENYSTTYPMSFACLAQAHRHRTLNYEMIPFKHNETRHYFVPPVIAGDSALVDDWYEDMNRVSESDFPQGMLVNVHESGKYTDFISKINERLCGRAQLEIMQRSEGLLHKYLRATENTNSQVHSELLQYSKGPKCTFPDAKCGEPCFFGAKGGLERLI